MPQYNVDVEFTSKKTVQVFARDEEQAEVKAADIVEKWDNVLEVTETTVAGRVQ